MNSFLTALMMLLLCVMMVLFTMVFCCFLGGVHSERLFLRLRKTLMEFMTVSIGLVMFETVL